MCVPSQRPLSRFAIDAGKIVRGSVVKGAGSKPAPFVLTLLLRLCRTGSWRQVASQIAAGTWHA